MQIFGDWDITQFLLLDKKISKERGLYACERESSLSLSIISSGNADDSEKGIRIPAKSNVINK